MAERRSQAVAVALVAAFLVLSLGGQALSDATMPRGYARDTGASIGRAGFAFMTGFRKYAAAVLWNTIDPLVDSYFHDTPFDKMRFMLPTITAVVALDPQAVEPYSVGSWIIVRNGKIKEGMALIRRGVKENPRSGVVRVAYAQMLQTIVKDLPAAHAQAAIALHDDIVWSDAADASDGYRSVLHIMESAHDKAGIALAKVRIEHADAQTDAESSRQ